MNLNEKQNKHKRICEQLNEIFVNKSNDYGDSFGRTYNELGIISAITRISDKYNRIVSLSKKTKEEIKVKDESIKDTLLDMANYCIMTVIEMESDFHENTLENNKYELTKEEFIASYESDDDFCFWVKDEGYDCKKRAIADRFNDKVVAVWYAGEQAPFKYTEDNYGTTWVACV